MRRIIFVFSIAALAAAELPVKKVVLYKHGVGYFERSGELDPGESARLDFKASEMDDVLKSLTLDSSGGAVAALRYDASEPTAARLAKFPIRLDPAKPLSSLLDQLKGERVQIVSGAQEISGLIVGARILPGNRENAEREQVSLLLDSGELVTRDLEGASIRFSDPTLQLQITDYLKVLSGARSKEKRSLYIDSVDSGRRVIRARYMIPTPIWKSSYRLIFSGDGDPILEGWAIVDNTTGDDWTKVELALVSGRPISFISRLYEPKYAHRQVAELPEERSRAPVVHEGAMAAAPPSPMAMRQAPGRRGAVVGGIVASEAFMKADTKEMDFVAPSTVTAAAEGRDLGELFEYRFSTAVTVKKNESAMLPFLQQSIGARKLLIYTDDGTQHPMNAAELENDTGKTLDGGPVTIFDAGAYAGEALMSTTKTGDKRLISYGVDLGTRVTSRFGSGRTVVRELHLRRGVLTTKSAVRQTKTYTIRNIDAREKTLVIEHAARPGFTLVDRQPHEKTAKAYRFRLPLPAAGTETFAVTEERVITSTHAVASVTPDFLLTYVENKAIDSQARERLGEIVDKKRAVAEANRALAQTERQRQELAVDQDRVRKNIASLNRVSGQQEQVQKYAAQLAEQESRLAGLRDRLSEIRKRKQGLESELQRLIETLEF